MEPVSSFYKNMQKPGPIILWMIRHSIGSSLQSAKRILTVILFLLIAVMSYLLWEEFKPSGKYIVDDHGQTWLIAAYRITS